jgi:ClpP class serine protease
VCDKESASVGSIGVVVQLTNDSEALKQAGYKRSFIYAGNSKIPFSEDGEFKEEFLSDLQESVNCTYEKFVEHVATYRPLSQQQIIDTQAKVFNADKALALKLVDKLSTHTEFIESFKKSSLLKNTPTTQTKATIDPAHMARIKAALDKAEQPQLTAKQEHKQKLQNAVRWFAKNKMKDK